MSRPIRRRSSLPDPPSRPPGGFGPRAIEMPVLQEERLYEHKLPAALAYARANALNRIVADAPGARIGVVAAGKAWQDVLQALGNLSLSEAAAALGLRLLKIGMVWPLDPVVVREFAKGLDLIVVVEEKRPLIEDQMRAILYGGRNAPRIVGKYFDGGAFDPSHGASGIPNFGESSPELVAQILARSLRLLDPACAATISEERARAAQQPSCPDAQSRLLRRLPAQSLDPRARRQPGACRHRLSQDGDAGQSAADHHRLAYGRRRRDVARPAAVHDGATRLRQYRRRHLCPFGHRSRSARRSRPMCR